MGGTGRAPLRVGVDIGTSGTKAVLTDSEGRALRVAARAHGTSRPEPGRAEHDPEATWWLPVADAIREVVGDAAADVGGVAVSGLGPCVAVTDRDGAPLRPAILYGVDTRSLDQIARMRAALGADDPRAGRLTTQSVGPKLLWVREQEPALWCRAARVFTSHTYAGFRLSGAYVLDRVSASWWDPLVEPDGSAWLAEDAARWAPGLELPDIVEPDAVVGGVTAEAAVLTGLAPGTPVHAGTTDYAAQVRGVGAREPGRCVVIFGSTLSVNVIASGRETLPGLSSSPGVRPGTWYVGGVTAAAGSLLQWVRRLSGGMTHERLAAEAAAAPPGSRGVLVLPYVSGERSPLEDPRLRGTIAGLDLSHGPGDVYRAAHEAIAFSLRHVLDALGDRRPGTLTATGGGASSTLLMQIVADVTGCEVTVADAPHAAATGSALLAGADDAARRTSAVFRPTAADAARYDGLYRLYLDLGGAVAPISHALSDLGALAAEGGA